MTSPLPDPAMFQQIGDGAVKVVAEHAQRRGHGVGFIRGRLIEIERQQDAARREVERLDATAAQLRASLERLGSVMIRAALEIAVLFGVVPALVTVVSWMVGP